MPAQCRGDVADGLPGSRLQDHRRFPQGQWPGHPQSLPRIHRGVRARGPARRHHGCYQRQQIQSGELARPEFHETKVAKRLEQLEASIERYLAELDTASRLRPKSTSSAASCSISCRKASTASGITAYSPPQAAPPISRGFASCLGQARLPGQVQVLAGTSPRRRSCRPVPVAAGA